MLTIDPLVLKLKLPRIEKLKSGKLSIKLLALCIRYDDWLTIVGNTIYTMTLVLYYNYRLPPLRTKRLINLILLNLILKLQILQDDDRVYLENIVNKLTGCSTCQFKKYVELATNIVNKYDYLVLRYLLYLTKPVLFKYPEISLPIVSKISLLYPLHFQKLNYTRKPCFDCVGKHIGTAYIKALLVIQGYTLHNILGLADLQEAFLLCPVLCTQLRNLLALCISKSIKDGQLFVPINLLARLLDLAKSHTELLHIANQPNSLDLTFKLLLLECHILSIRLITIPLLLEIKRLILLLHIMLKDPEADLTVLKHIWSGYLARLALVFSVYNIQISDILRNRRLLFKLLPKAALDTDYDCSDILRIINLCHL